MKPIEVVCMGLSSVDVSVRGHLKETFFTQSCTQADSVSICVGGDAINQAQTLARLGHRAVYMGSVGRDAAGECILSQAKAAGVDVSHVRVLDNTASAICVTMIDDGDDRHSVPSTAASSNKAFCLDTVDLDAVRAAKVVSFGSLFCFPRLSDEDLTAIFAAAKDGGALTCADMKLIEGAAMEQFSQALKKLDYLFANEDEAAAFSGQGTPEDMADYFLSLGVGHVIVKLGGRGCLIKGGGECRRVPPFYVKPVDTTGAGDNFAAGFISALCRDLPFAECARFASATAAITVQSIGSSTGVKSMGQVLSFIENYPSKEGKKTT